jgi:arabinose-5-phosphate isomerase
MTSKLKLVDTTPSFNPTEVLEPTYAEVGRMAIQSEANGLLRLAESLGSEFESAVGLILACSGRLVVTGMGKSGHVGRKISATFSSTGTPSLFVHPAEASHGDLGMISRSDAIIAISKSGETPELSDVVSYSRRFGIPLVAITSGAKSALGSVADVLLLMPDATEACPMGLAPTTSTTMMLALGDALAIACLKHRNFRATDFKEFHPGGKLGMRLKRARDIMYSGAEMPIVESGSPLSSAILEMTRTRLGCVGIVNSDGFLIGIFTDGDLRRCISSVNISENIDDHMFRGPFEMDPEALVEEVALLFNSHRIPSVFVTREHKPIGVIHMHSLLGSGLI